MADIAFDSVLTTSIHSGSPTSPVTDSFTNTAGNSVRIGIVARGAGDVVTGVTYGGQTCTQLPKVQEGGGIATFAYIYGLENAPTGANTISVAFSGAPTDVRVGALSYTNVSGADAAHSNSGTGAAGVTDSITTVANNSWAIMWVWNENGNPTAGTGATARGTAANPMFFDSNGAITPAGSYSMTVSWGGSVQFADLMVSLAPQTASSGMLNFFS